MPISEIIEQHTAPARTGSDPLLKKVKARRSEMSELFDRMDDDKDLYYNKKFQLKNFKRQNVKNVENVTIPAAALYSHKVMASLVGANQQVVVEGDKLQDREIKPIEDFVTDAFLDVDGHLAQEGIAGLFNYCVEQVCIRGRVAARCIIREEDGQRVLDVMPLDARYLTYPRCKGGLPWAAYISKRSKEEIAEEYENYTPTGKGGYATVTEAWDDKVNKVWVNTNLVHTADNPLGYPPFVIQVVPAGSMLSDEHSLKHTGESLFALARGLFEELNKTATVLQTLNLMAVNPPVQRESEAGEGAEPVPHPPVRVGAVVNVDKGMGFKPMPLADVHAATRLFYSMLESYLQRATLAALDYGNLNFPLSAVAIGRLTDNKDQTFLPRLQCLASFFQQLAYMIIRQAMVQGGELTLGEHGHKRTHVMANLSGDYSIKFKYFSTSPEQDIANYAVASQAQQFLSEDAIRRDVLKLKDPDGVAAERRSDLAERVDPLIALMRLGHSLIDEAHNGRTEKDLEARLILKRIVSQLTARQAGPMEGEEEEIRQAMGPPKQTGQPLVPLLSSGQGGGRRAEPEGGE